MGGQPTRRFRQQPGQRGDGEKREGRRKRGIGRGWVGRGERRGVERRDKERRTVMCRSYEGRGSVRIRLGREEGEREMTEVE